MHNAYSDLFVDSFIIHLRMRKFMQVCCLPSTFPTFFIFTFLMAHAHIKMHYIDGRMLYPESRNLYKLLLSNVPSMENGVCYIRMLHTFVYMHHGVDVDVEGVGIATTTEYLLIPI